MREVNILVIRLVLGLVIAVILIRIFGLAFHPVNVGLLTAILVGLAYGKEYLRRWKSSRHGKSGN